MSNHPELGPFGDIVEVIRMPDGALLAYDAEQVLIVELDEDGLGQICTMMPGIRVTDAIPQGKARGGIGPIVGGATWIAPVRVRTTGPVYLKQRTCPIVVDGVSLAKGDRILVADQPNPQDNVIYKVWRTDRGIDSSGRTTGHSWLKVDDKVECGTGVRVLEGDTFGNTVWIFDLDNWTQIGVSGGGGTAADLDVDAAFADLLSSPMKASDTATKVCVDKKVEDVDFDTFWADLLTD